MRPNDPIYASIKRYPVTQVQLEACERLIDPATKEVFYKVRSSTDEEKKHEVRYNRTRQMLTCTCPAGISYHYSCWHRRAVVVYEWKFRRGELVQPEPPALPKGQQPIDEVDPKWVAYLEGSPTEWARHELAKLKEFGLKAYESEGFKGWR